MAEDPDSLSGKAQKARLLGIPIVGYATYFRMIEKLGFSSFHLSLQIPSDREQEVVSRRHTDSMSACRPIRPLAAYALSVSTSSHCRHSTWTADKPWTDDSGRRLTETCYCRT